MKERPSTSRRGSTFELRPSLLWASPVRGRWCVCVLCLSVCVRTGGEEGFIQSKAINEVDAGRDRATPASVRHDADRATPASVRHDADEALTPITPCYRSTRDVELEQKRSTSVSPCPRSACTLTSLCPEP